MPTGSRIFPSITARLIFGLTLGTTMLWCGAAAYSTYISGHEFNEAFDRALAGDGSATAAARRRQRAGHEADDDARAIQHFIEGAANISAISARFLRPHRAARP